MSMNLIPLKVHPTTLAWAPIGYAWTWNTLLCDWILTQHPDEPRT